MVVCAGTVWGCGENRLSPASPSLVSAPRSEAAPRSGTTLTPRRIDADGDGYEDPEGPPTDPGMIPPPGQVPPPEGMPAPEGIPPPVQLTISIVGSFGPTAYAPNPQQVAIGNTIIWVNNDFAPHNIVLADGTPVGNLAPGQSSVPLTVVTETMTYQCTIHPSMTGQIVPIPPLVPTDPSQVPVPDPSGMPMPTPDPYGYDDGYDDYDY